MNKVVLCGRLTKAPVISYSNELCVARYTLAVDRKTKDESADFISCVAFGKAAEFVEKYLTQGMKILVEGRIQTGSYKNKEGKTVYTSDVCIESHEFVEKKESDSKVEPKTDDFMKVPEEEGLPFN